MQQVMRFSAPRVVEVIDVPSPQLQPGQARLHTLASGVSAGTELTAYRGTNPYLTSSWDPTLRLFTDAHPDAPSYPLQGWGYSEVGTVVELGAAAAAAASAAETTDAATTVGTGKVRSERSVQVGDTVWGIWGHRSEAVVDAVSLRGHQLPAGLDPLAGCFVRVGAIALNAVLAADCGVGDTVAVFGQGVIGLLATRFAVLSGAKVIAVDGIERRRAMAVRQGASHVLAPGEHTARVLRELTEGRGADMAIEISGSYLALREAIRAVGVECTVVAAGFYQGPAAPLQLGAEFHHNRVSVVASQIGAIPNRLLPRWDRDRLQRTVVDAIADGRLDVLSLVTHRFPLADAAAAFELIDRSPQDALQVVLEVP